jgi:hypothetical protein
LVGSLIAGQQRGLANRDGFPAIKGLGSGESDDGLIQQRWEAGVQWQVRRATWPRPMACSVSAGAPSV